MGVRVSGALREVLTRRGAARALSRSGLRDWLEGEETADCLLGGLFALLGGLGAVFGLLQCLLQGLQSGVGHCGRGACLIALNSGLPQVLAFGGELLLQPGDVRGEFLADPAGLGAGHLSVLLCLLPVGLGTLGTATCDFQVDAGLIEIGGAVGQRGLQGGDLPVVVAGRGGGLTAFGVQDALQGVAFGGDAPGSALSGRGAFGGQPTSR